MAEKATAKIIDVQGPGKVAPTATARPILVSNQTEAPKDPMMVSDDAKPEDTKTEAIISHGTKTIKPVSADMKEPADNEESKPDEAEVTSSDDTAEADDDEAKTTPASIDAAAAEAEAAKAARERELEGLIDSGKYAVPIDAVQRQRSRMYVTLLCLLALVLAVALFDVVLDAGLIKLSPNIPHTHFFGS